MMQNESIFDAIWHMQSNFYQAVTPYKAASYQSPPIIVSKIL